MTRKEFGRGLDDLNATITEARARLQAQVKTSVLRDYFAGQALAGMIANPDISQDAARRGLTTQKIRESFAQSAYKMADLMMAARGGKI